MNGLWILLAWFTIPMLTAHCQQERTQKSEHIGQGRTYELKSIRIEGEVDEAGTFDLTSLALHSFPVKELALENGKEQFKGAFTYSGYSLSDVLNSTGIKKANASDYPPFVDLYLVIENAKGEKVVVSWAEVQYSRDPHRFLLTTSVEPIVPSKIKATWPLPDESRLICGNDRLNARFLNRPTRITVHSFKGSFAGTKRQNMFSPDITVFSNGRSSKIVEIDANVEKRTHTHVGFGHGMGFKGLTTIQGFVLAQVLKGLVDPEMDALRQAILVVSAKDGYRAVLSVSEIFNRSDNVDFLLIDRNESTEDGRYILFATPDFYVDRNVKAIAKMEVTFIKD